MKHYILRKGSREIKITSKLVSMFKRLAGWQLVSVVDYEIKDSEKRAR